MNTELFQEYAFAERTIRAGTLIIAEEEVPKAAFVIISGIVRMYTINDEGVEQTISIDQAGTIFPLAWTLDLLPHAQYFYEALTECRMYLVEKETVQTALENDRAIAHQVWRSLGIAHLNLQLHTEALGRLSAKDTLLSILYLLSLRYGHDISQNRVMIDLPLTQTLLASLCGNARETIAKLLAEFKRSGLITKQSQRYIVNTDKLNKLIPHDYSASRIAAS